MQSCKMLLCAGADINARSLQGLIPAQIAPEPLQKLLQGNREGMWYKLSIASCDCVMDKSLNNFEIVNSLPQH